MEIAKRSSDSKSFVTLPRRWVVETTFCRFRNRHLTKDLENLAVTPATFVSSPLFSFASGDLPGHRSSTQQTTVSKCIMTEVGKSDGKGTFAGTRGNVNLA
jgi:hypothetical protein